MKENYRRDWKEGNWKNKRKGNERERIWRYIRYKKGWRKRKVGWGKG